MINIIFIYYIYYIVLLVLYIIYPVLKKLFFSCLKLKVIFENVKRKTLSCKNGPPQQGRLRKPGLTENQNVTM